MKLPITRPNIVDAPPTTNTLELPGIPCLYSLKETLPFTSHTDATLFRNRKFKAFLRCMLPRMGYEEPLVLLCRFFVKPLLCHDIPRDAVLAETMPAMHAHETLDYTLSLMDMLNDYLVKDLRNLVKIHADKFYSDNPRTLLKLMHWEDYHAHYGNSDPFKAPAKAVSSGGKVRLLQPLKQRDDPAPEPASPPAQEPPVQEPRAPDPAPAPAPVPAKEKVGPRYRRLTRR